MAGKKKTIAPDAGLAALKRANAGLVRQLDERTAAYAAAQARNVQLTTELRGAGDRQAASAEILRTIASVSGNAERSLLEIAATTKRLFEASSVSIFVAHGDEWGQIIHDGASSERIGAEVPASQLRIGSHSLPGATFAENRQIHVPDIDNVDPAIADWPGVAPARAAGSRTISGTPLRRAGQAVGVLIVHRNRLAPFTAEELALLQSFADQAAIAIANARLFNETEEALERQTATAEILKVIASSPDDVQPVFDAIAERSNRLVEGLSTAVHSLVDDTLHLVAFTPISPEADRALKASFPLRLSSQSWGNQTRNGEIVHILDSEIEWAGQPALLELVRLRGFRSLILVPLLRDGKSIGQISVTRKAPGAFSAHHVQLLQTFADQAVIAIENVRLFNETKEALERQTATADILKVIASSPSDVQPVFEAIATSSNTLIGGFSTAVMRFIGEELHLAAFTPTNPAADEVLKASFPRPLAEFPAFLLVRDGETVQFADTEAEDVPHLNRDLARLRGFRSMLFTPLISGGTPIGLISVTRKEPGPFAAHHTQLVRTFADQAVIAIENVRLFDEVQAKTRELSEALTYQTGSGNILKVIASSPTDVGPVLNAIVENACELCEADDAVVHLRDGDELYYGAHHGDIPVGFERRPLNRDLVTGRSVVDRVPIHLHDVLSAEGDEFPEAQQLSRRVRIRTILSVPLLRDDQSIGAIVLRRTDVNPFNEKQIALLQTFADQAVIALGNVSLFEEVQAKTRDLSESLQQQTATADVLKVISRSAFDLDSVLATLLASAAGLCEAEKGVIFLRKDDHFAMASNYGFSPEFEAFAKANPYPAESGSTTTRSAAAGIVVHVADVLADETQSDLARQYQRLGGHRTIMGVPLRREGETIGVFTLSRQVVRPFTDRQIELVETFADQAVIAIENVRLFDEVQARTRDLSESLEQQTATSEVLEVISSSPGELKPVFQKMLENATRVCGASFGVMNLWDGTDFNIAADYNVPPAFAASRSRMPIRPFPDSGLAKVVKTHQVAHIHDVRSSPAYLAGAPYVTEMVDIAGARTLVIVPMLKENELIGTIAIYRQEVRPFSDKQIALVENFTKQAVIAIENTRLLKELRQRTDDLSESLQQQTATADVLKVISRSAFDLQAVFDTLLSSAVELSGAANGTICVREGELFPYRATMGINPAFAQFLAEHPATPGRQSAAARVILSGEVVCIPDILEDSEYTLPVVSLQQPSRSCLGVPLLRNDRVEGALVLVRTEPGPFDQRQIDLVKTFADQAVIAIENVRLFDEVQAKTRDLTEALTYQTGSGNILKVIASSPTDVGPVLAAIAENAAELCDAYDAAVLLQDGGDLRFSAHHGSIPLDLEKWPINRNWTAGRAFLDKKPVHIHDLRADENADFPEGRELSLRMGHRSILSVPLLLENESIGAIVLRRKEVHPFSGKQIGLLQTFADQAVIAIGNVRLFEQVQQRTRELSQSLDDLRTAQDRLVQTEKLASLGQLTAGIAHEIKNPLNFVNNFSALSAELVDELNDALKPVPFDGKTRQEIGDLTQMLKGNLEKVVQHGKRADSIVKNMLLHSREGSGEHRPADINALLDESLNLAYHGARAEKSEFNITLHRDFDDSAGMIELFPQEITRALLNLISNGFYAATKRKTEAGNPDFEPALRASTKNRGNTVEIRIRDNGTGIPAEVKEKMFNPFFTTKPAGEGTGLGLSMSHDIVVKQHGGSIDVATEPGQFTEFTIVLPRTSNLQEKKQDKQRDQK